MRHTLSDNLRRARLSWAKNNYGALARIGRNAHVSRQWVWAVLHGMASNDGSIERELLKAGAPGMHGRTKETRRKSA